MATHTDDFSVDNYTDVGGDTGVAGGQMVYACGTVNSRSYDNIGALYFGNKWTFEITLRVTSLTDGGAGTFRAYFGASSTNDLWADTPDSIQVVITDDPGLKFYSVDGGAVDASSATIGIALNTTYYITLERLSATQARLSVFSDAGRTVHVAGSPETITIAATVTGEAFVVFQSEGTRACYGWADDLTVTSYPPPTRAWGLPPPLMRAMGLT